VNRVDAPLIALHDVGRSFDDGAVVALRGIELAVAQGEFVSIVGRSGSGKTSLVHMMAGFDWPSSGQVSWQGRAIAERGAWTALRRSEIGIVFQEFLLLPTLSARENVEIAISGAPAREARKRAAGLLDRVGLGQRTEHLPHALSGGERQRVAIARSLANRPKLLIADEPTGSLDSTNAALVLELLLELRRERGAALVLVTHEEAIAERADRVVHLSDGRLAGGPGNGALSS
jgi:predicted ABC-type transport system involved in lysophospholipase L1 biosynthesis ATPase subunit